VRPAIRYAELGRISETPDQAERFTTWQASSDIYCRVPAECATSRFLCPARFRRNSWPWDSRSCARSRARGRVIAGETGPDRAACCDPAIQGNIRKSPHRNPCSGWSGHAATSSGELAVGDREDRFAWTRFL